MGQSICSASNPELQQIYFQQQDAINGIVLREAALQHIKKQYPKIANQTESKLSSQEKRPLLEVDRQKNIAQNELSILKQQVKLQYGSLSNFQQKTGASFKQHLNYPPDLDRFDTFKKECRSEYAVKSGVIMKSLNNLKDMFLINYKKEHMYHCPSFETLGIDKQQTIISTVKGDLKPNIEKNNKLVLEQFKEKMAFELFQNNLSQLQSVRNSSQFCESLIQRWQRIIQNLS